jgi:uncharacterized BrkB/YihY/UPF0761 family membrane protein
MVVGQSRELFSVIAEAAATLTGLLFVAVSLAPRHESTSHLGVVQQIRAAASLLAFTSALAISLFGLVTGNNVGYPALVLGITGVTFTAASLRSIFESTDNRRLIRKQMGLIVLLLATFGFELGSGVVLIGNPHSHSALDTLENVMAASLLIGVARAWELVGARDTGLFSSLLALSGHERSTRQSDAQSSTPNDRLSE